MQVNNSRALSIVFSNLRRKPRRYPVGYSIISPRASKPPVKGSLANYVHVKKPEIPRGLIIIRLGRSSHGNRAVWRPGGGCYGGGEGGLNPRTVPVTAFPMPRSALGPSPYSTLPLNHSNACKERRVPPDGLSSPVRAFSLNTPGLSTQAAKKFWSAAASSCSVPLTDSHMVETTIRRMLKIEPHAPAFVSCPRTHALPPRYETRRCHGAGSIGRIRWHGKRQVAGPSGCTHCDHLGISRRFSWVSR